MLTVPVGISDALASEQMQFAWLIKIGDDLAFTNHAVNIDFNGDTYTSEGDLLRLPSIVRERSIKLQSITLEFSNADGVMSFRFRNKYDPGIPGYAAYDRTGDPCELYLVLLGDGDAIIENDAVSLYKGFFDTWIERDSENSSSISLRITSPWAKPNLTAGRVTSDHNQKDFYAGDMFFEFAHEEKNTIGWGGDA